MWVNDIPVSELAKQIDAECFRTGKDRATVINEFRERQKGAIPQMYDRGDCWPER